MKITASQLQKILPKTKDDAIVRLHGTSLGLESVLVGSDYRIRQFTPAPGSLGPLYVPAAPLAKAAAVRADDIPVSIEDTGEVLRVTHGEFELSVPKVTDKTFTMPAPIPVAPASAPGFTDRLKKVLAIAGAEDRAGILITWSPQDVRLLSVSARAQAHGAKWEGRCEDSGRAAVSVTAALQVSKLGTVQRWWLQDGGVFFELNDSTVVRASRIRDIDPSQDPWEGTLGAFPAVSCEFDAEELRLAIVSASSGLTKGDIGVTLTTVGTTEDGVVWEISGKASRGKNRSARERVLAISKEFMPVNVKLDASRLLTSLKELSGKVALRANQRSVLLEDNTLRAVLTALV